MISKIGKRGNGFRGLLNYLIEGRERKGVRGQIIGGNLDGIDARGLAAEFKVARQMRPDVKTPVWPCSIGLPAGERVSPAKFAEIAEEFAGLMDFTGKHPRVFILHEDTEHQHVHIVASRIAVDGSLWAGKHDYQRAMDACRVLEKKYGLTLVASPDKAERRAKKNAPIQLPTTPKEVSMLSRSTPKTDRAVRAERRAERRGTKPNDPVFLRVTTLDALRLVAAPLTLKAFLLSKGIEVMFNVQKARAAAEGAAPAEGEGEGEERIYGWKLRQAGAEEWLSASSVHRDLSWPRVRATLAQNAEREEQHQEIPAPAITEDRRQAEGARISGRIDESLARLNRRDLDELHAAALQPDRPQLGGAPREPISELLRRLLDLMLRALSFGSLSLGATQEEYEAQQQAQARQELIARIEAEQQRRAERQALAEDTPKKEGEKPTLRVVKTHDARPPAAPQQPAEDGQEDQDQYPRERGG